MTIRIMSPGGRVVEYPPNSDVRYGDLVRLRNLARELGKRQIADDLQERVDRFFDKQSPLDLFGWPT